jgi:hypothetical protein
MSRLRFTIDRLAEVPLKKRVVSWLLWLGIPWLIWQTTELSWEMIKNKFVDPTYLGLCLAIAIIDAGGTALVAALIEHGILVGLKTRTKRASSSDAILPHS